MTAVELMKISTFCNKHFFDTTNNSREMSSFVIQYYANERPFKRILYEALICFPAIYFDA
jgi:hypothetical protein